MKPVEPQKRTRNISDEYNQNFSMLINAIIKGEVILVVGSNFEFNSEKNKEYLPFEEANFLDYVYSVVKEGYQTDALDFSELENDPHFSYKDPETKITRKANIYMEINRIVEQADLKIEDVSKSLRKLLSTGYFRFVMTMSYSPLVEIAMKHQWGENNVNVLNVYDSDLTKRDISLNQSELRNPTVYYLLGKAGTIQKFAVTDNDYLKIMKTTIIDMSNSNLMEMTASKHLLVLGCDQDDWLFRFIWYILKVNETCLKDGCIGRKERDTKLDRFLVRNGVSLNYDSKKFAEDIYNALMRNSVTHLFNDPRCQKWDVFISYSRKDGDIAQRVYDALTSVGLKVWYDKTNLAGRGVHYMEYIYEAIRSSTIFMPILSSTITEQREDKHPYRLEWKYAIEEGNINQTGITSCIPIIEQQYDINTKKFSDKIPEVFTKLDGYLYNVNCPVFEMWAEQVKDIISKKE